MPDHRNQIGNLEKNKLKKKYLNHKGNQDGKVIRNYVTQGSVEGTGMFDL